MDEWMAWLLDGPPWVAYRTRLDLMGQGERDEDVQRARGEMLSHPLVQGLLQQLADWPEPALTSHKSAGHPIHLLSFVSELGLNQGDAELSGIIERILERQSAAGPFYIQVKIPLHFGGSGKEEPAWFLCDAPLVTAALVRMGLGEDERIQRAVESLLGLVCDNGWRCTVSPEMGRFRGPGRKGDPCPYANLVILKLLAALPEQHDSPPARLGAETLLQLWQNRREQHPYLFRMGTDFCKLKAPLVWYDLLHLCDVLTQFAWLRDDPRLLEMVEMVRQKGDAKGRFVPESIWKAWKDWDFGQKREPSRWLTFLSQRVLFRMGGYGIERQTEDGIGYL